MHQQQTQGTAVAQPRQRISVQEAKRWLKTPKVYEVLLHWSEQAWPLSRQTPKADHS